MRVFVAVKLDKKIKNEIAKISADIERACGTGRYVDPENYHITLEFIGEADPCLVKEIKRVMDDAANRCRTFDVVIEGVGRFARGGSSIVWMGASHGSSELMELNRKLRLSLSGIGIDSDGKKFNPHITIGRKVVCDDSLNDLQSGKWIQKVDRIVLMESARIKGKLMYTPIYESRFER